MVLHGLTCACVGPCGAPQIAYREAEALKRQDQLIKEEFEMQLMEETRLKAQAEKDKEKKAKKKVGKCLRLSARSSLAGGRCWHTPNE